MREIRELQESSQRRLLTFKSIEFPNLEHIIHHLVEEGWNVSTAITAYRAPLPPPAPALPQPFRALHLAQTPAHPRRLHQYDPIQFPPLPDTYPDNAYTYIDLSDRSAKSSATSPQHIDQPHAAKCPQTSSHPIKPSTSITMAIAPGGTSEAQGSFREVWKQSTSRCRSRRKVVLPLQSSACESSSIYRAP
jgi:hypothetical protein